MSLIRQVAEFRARYHSALRSLAAALRYPPFGVVILMSAWPL
jgi:hypothetical protein